MTTENKQPDERAAVPLAWQSTFEGLLAYVLQDDLHNRLTPRVIDIAYTAFMNGACGQNKEDGGKCDWFNDTKPVVQAAIEKIRKELDEARATTQQANKGDERAAFEAWASEEGLDILLSPNWANTTFHSLPTEDSWRGWQARAAAPQADTLSDEQIEEIWNAIRVDDVPINDRNLAKILRVRFARALLAAHPTEQRMSDSETSNQAEN